MVSLKKPPEWSAVDGFPVGPHGMSVMSSDSCHSEHKPLTIFISLLWEESPSALRPKTWGGGSQPVCQRIAVRDTNERLRLKPLQESRAS